MKTSEENSVFLKKLAKSLITIGEIHAKSVSMNITFYEPKIPTNLLKSNK
ncbi:AgrD family cyclic lactone autoinducer peptide [Clostridium tagluense]|nr:cyclic lactone autoinducer peptide [Clostridium tagluense]MBW9159447.1 cyclic lactone autoinducer peptide [Clostridium tagluense]WLC68454.1 cyclic lactone autoinducer peptide [Clostridium tagluense]